MTALCDRQSRTFEGAARDGGPELPADTRRWPIHRPPPALAGQRSSRALLETGVKVIDLLAPPARGGKAAQLNHTIVWSSDQSRSAKFLAEMLGRPAPTRFAHFDVVELVNGVSLDFADTEGPIRPQHYAFLIGEADFDAVLGRMHERGPEHWADPARRRAGEFNHNDGGRGVYFPDPDGHFLEVITRPYGAGAA